MEKCSSRWFQAPAFKNLAFYHLDNHVDADSINSRLDSLYKQPKKKFRIRQKAICVRVYIFLCQRLSPRNQGLCVQKGREGQKNSLKRIQDLNLELKWPKTTMDRSISLEVFKILRYRQKSLLLNIIGFSIKQYTNFRRI